MKTTQSIALAALLLIAGATTSFAQEKGKKDTTTVQAQKDSYTCPMHPEVIIDKPGKCPKCGMDLIVDKSKASSDTKADTKAIYTCPMHSDVASDKPGDCPKCGMALVEKNKTKKGKKKGWMSCCM